MMTLHLKGEAVLTSVNNFLDIPQRCSKVSPAGLFGRFVQLCGRLVSIQNFPEKLIWIQVRDWTEHFIIVLTASFRSKYLLHSFEGCCLWGAEHQTLHRKFQKRQGGLLTLCVYTTINKTSNIKTDRIKTYPWNIFMRSALTRTPECQCERGFAGRWRHLLTLTGFCFNFCSRHHRDSSYTQFVLISYLNNSFYYVYVLSIVLKDAVYNIKPCNSHYLMKEKYLMKFK